MEVNCSHWQCCAMLAVLMLMAARYRRAGEQLVVAGHSRQRALVGASIRLV
jgi:hypothetical protein